MWKETSNFLRASSQGPLQHKKGVIKKEVIDRNIHRLKPDQQWETVRKTKPGHSH